MQQDTARVSSAKHEAQRALQEQDAPCLRLTLTDCEAFLLRCRCKRAHLVNPSRAAITALWHKGAVQAPDANGPPLAHAARSQTALLTRVCQRTSKFSAVTPCAGAAWWPDTLAAFSRTDANSAQAA